MPVNKLTPKQYDQKILELIQMIRDNTAPFPNDTKESKKFRMQEALVDLFCFAKTYFPHYITKPFGEFHKEMDAATNKQQIIVAIAGPRKHGKSVLLAIIKPIWKVLREDVHFPIFVSESRDQSEERTLAIKLEFLYNKRLIKDFGEQVRFGQGKDFDFVTKIGARFLALGYKMPIRSKLHGAYRPDWIVIDDFESHMAQNPRIARQKLEYVRQEAYGALGDKEGIVVWIGNRTHKDSALSYFAALVEEEHVAELVYLEYKAILDDGTPLWSEGFTLNDLYQMKRAMGRVGFERHMMMNPIVEGIIFKSGWFKYYYPSSQKKFDRIVTYCDPAIGTSHSSDYRAIITLAFKDKRYYLLDCYLRKSSLSSMLHKLYELDNQYETRIYMESNFWQRLLWDYVQDMSEEYGYLLPVSGVENTIKKSERIEAITPLYEWGWILHYDPKDEDLIYLEEQLTNYPDHPHDDGPDALAGAISVMKRFSGPMEARFVPKKSNDFKILF